MSDDRPGFYSMTHVSPMDSIVVRQPARMTDREKAIVDAIALLEREGFTVTRKGTPMANSITATIEGRYIPDQFGK